MSGRMRGLLRERDPGQAGQALVEFAISVTAQAADARINSLP